MSEASRTGIAWSSDYGDRPGLGALHGGSRAWWRAPCLPLAVGAAIAPTAAVLQSKAMAPIAIVTMLLAVIAHRREARVWPWPGGPAVWMALALAAWGAASAAWAPDQRAALAAAGTLAGLALLASAAGRAALEDGWRARRVLGWAVVGGLAAGLLAAALDHLTGQGLRMAVRGLSATRPGLEFGLKPAASVMALLLPLVLALPIRGVWRWLIAAAGAAVILILPGDTAKVAAVAGLAAAGLVAVAGRAASALLGTAAAAALVAAPLLMPMVLNPEVAGRANLSGLHRLLIWDFAIERAAEKPLTGWGMEASRAIPGGHDNPSPASLARLGVTQRERIDWSRTPGVERMPLHPHNGALQIALELGWPGLILAGLLVLALAWGSGPVAFGVLASAAVTFLASFGVWQPWWVASQALAAALAMGLAGRRL
ncbi:O-antigen ligase family protein [Muricoccus radiodurans]|uniref:O-antigen ligase family protein n=1 Tax=Muricoccus radiodurans TaxID=2231721 RepID=UPI003CEB0B86